MGKKAWEKRGLNSQACVIMSTYAFLASTSSVVLRPWDLT